MTARLRHPASGARGRSSPPRRTESVFDMSWACFTTFKRSARRKPQSRLTKTELFMLALRRRAHAEVSRTAYFLEADRGRPDIGRYLGMWVLPSIRLILEHIPQRGGGQFADRLLDLAHLVAVSASAPDHRPPRLTGPPRIQQLRAARSIPI